MQALRNRYNYLFRSTKGLALVAVAMISLVSAVFGMLSGPMAEWGVSEAIARTLGMSLIPAEREGRIVILYHVIANAVVALEVYFITASVKMRKHQQANINAVVTVGYLTTMIFGLWFAYWGHNYIFHGVFLFGESMMFYGGILLASPVALE